MKIGDWVDASVPAVPTAIRRRLRADGAASAEGFAEAAASAMEEALACGPAERRGAHLLLAADAYVTWACLLALREDDVPAALDRAGEPLRRAWEARS